MEEEKARQDKMSGGSAAVPASTSPKKSAGAMEEDDLLAQAIAMSMGEQAAKTEDVEMGEALNDEDEEMKRAIAMSLVWRVHFVL